MLGYWPTSSKKPNLDQYSNLGGHVNTLHGQKFVDGPFPFQICFLFWEGFQMDVFSLDVDIDVHSASRALVESGNDFGVQSAF